MITRYSDPRRQRTNLSRPGLYGNWGHDLWLPDRTIRFFLEINCATGGAKAAPAAERSLRELGRSRLYRARILMIVIAGVRLARTAKEIERISEVASAGAS